MTTAQVVPALRADDLADLLGIPFTD